MSRFSGNQPAGLAVVCLAQFVVVLDVTIVATALPTIRDALGFSALGLPWVVTAYTLVLGGLLVAGGRLADLAGGRRALMAGLLVFGAASAACALAWSPAMLLGARAVKAVGAALLMPAGLALLTEIGGGRRALGWWTAAAASGGASGWVLGGLATEYAGWRSVFWINVPVGLLALVAARVVLPPGRRRRVRPDLPGALLATAALGLGVYGLTRVGAAGPVPTGSWAPLLAAAGLAAVLVRHLQRTAEPLFPPSLLRSRPVAGANLTASMLTATTTSAMFLAVLHVQRELSPARAAMLFPVFNVVVITGSLAAPALLRAAGARRVLLGGFAGIGAGAALLTAQPDGRVAIGGLLVSFALMGAGLGVASVASTQVGTEAAPTPYRGVSAGVLSSSAQIGNALGLALVVPLTAAAGAIGQRAGFAAAAVLALAGMAAGLLVPSRAAARPGRRHRKWLRDRGDEDRRHQGECRRDEQRCLQ